MFLFKLMQLPIGFFDTKTTGDLLQRVQDHHRIETLLTGTTLGVLFSAVNLVVFGAVLAVYSPLDLRRVRRRNRAVRAVGVAVHAAPGDLGISPLR